MATTFVEYTGDGQASKQFTFPSYQESDVKVRVDGVLKTTSTHYNITNYTTTGGGNVVFTSGNIPSSPANIRIYRDTNVDTAKATFTAGSSVKAADLNNNTTQLLYRAQEEQIPNLIHSYDIDDSAIETSKIKADAVTNAKIADNSIDSEHYVDGSIDSAHISSGAVTNSKIDAGAVTTASLGTNAVTTAKILDAQVTAAKIADGNVITAKVADGAITSAKLASGTVATGDLADGLISTAKIAADAVTNAKIADDSIDSEHYVDGSIDTAHIGDSQITSAKIADGTIVAGDLASNAVTTAKITDANVTTAKIADSNVTTAKIAADAVNGTKIADDSIDSEHYVDGSIDTAHIGDSQVTTAKIADDNITSAKIASNAVTTDKIADGELTTLAGMQSTTASNLASSTALTATTAELNQLDGITLETSVTTNSDTRIPTSKAVNDLVLSVVNAVGGFVAIANETSFPTSNPDPSNNAGTVVSISQLASGLAVNGSGVATITNGAGSGNTVTITGFPNSLYSQTLPASSGLQVQTTSTLHTYTFHKQLASAADIQAISATVNSFSNRYRVSASAPTSSLDGGDLWYDTTNSKLMVYSSQNSAWEESSAIGNFFISTISSSSNTGGGSATPNGTAYRFTISNAPVSAQQLIVSVDGVIQKPNSGSSQPSEGFVLVGNDIIFGAAPANGASIFVIVIGSTVGIGTPSDNTVTTAILQNGSVTTAKITDANITTAKIADSAVTSAKIADGTIVNADINASASIDVSKLSGVMPSGGGAFTGDVSTRTLTPASGISNADLGGSTLKYRNLHLSGNINVDGTVDGVDVAALYTATSSLSTGGGVLHPGVTIGNGVVATTQSAGDNTQKVATTAFVQTAVGNVTTDLVGDTTPQLGGDLDCNGKEILIDDNNAIKIGNSADLRVLHDGTHSEISNYTGTLYVLADSLFLGSRAAGEPYFKGFSNGAAELYYDTSKRLETTSYGIDVNGSIHSSGDLLVNDDNQKILIGGGNDLQIYHDGSNSYIDNHNGYLILRGNTGQIQINPVDNENSIIAKPNGAVELYHDNAKKFETTSHGVLFDGTGGDTYWYDGSGSNPLKWLYTDNVKTCFGTGSDLEIYHGGTNSQIDNNTGDLNIRSDVLRLRDMNNEQYLAASANAGVELYYNNNKKFETTTNGAAVTGYLQIHSLPAVSYSDSRAISLSNADLTRSNFYNHTNFESDSSILDSNGHFVAPVHGIYRLYVRITTDNNSGNRANIRLRKNGNTINEAYAVNTSGKYQSVSSEIITDLNQGQYLDVQVAQLYTMSGSQHKVVNFHMLG